VIADVNLFGVFFDVALITALIAVAVLTILHRLLAAIGAYRWVWHPALVDLGAFLVIWFALAVLATRFQESLVNLFG
jgi:hypothetical protein